MKTMMSAVATLLLAAAAAAAGHEARVVLEGDSTMHRYSSTATIVEVSARVDAAEADFERAVRAGEVRGLAVRVPVQGLRSGKAGLDKNMRSALKAEDHPWIRFELARYELSPDGRLKAFGRLSAAGREKDAVLEGTGRFEEEGFLARGGVELRMTDFGIKPPTMFLGALKTDDRVVIAFELKLRRRP